ncbi:MAG: hypothetical protein WED12_06270, partial [Chloroflexota bacterium]
MAGGLWGAWRKPPPEFEARFREAVAALPGAEVGKMFGYPAAFANGHLTIRVTVERQWGGGGPP